MPPFRPSKPSSRKNAGPQASKSGQSEQPKNDKKASPKQTEGIRLNKFIADTGYCSRRQADLFIQEGRVTINGRVAESPGERVRSDGNDKVAIDRQVIQPARKVYIAFHKPRDVITTRYDEQGRRTLYDFLPEHFHSVDPAGRLDRDSSGLLILTNDGDLLYRLTHPRFHVAKTYQVKTKRPFTSTEIEALLKGVHLMPEDKLAQVAEIVQTESHTYRMTLITGLNRQIRRSIESLGNEVHRLKRLSFGPLHLDRLPPGEFRLLKDAEVKSLEKASRKGSAAKPKTSGKTSRKRPTTR